MQDNSKILVRWFEEVWNQKKLETVDEIFTPDTVVHDGAITTKGPKAFKDFYARIQTMFSDVRITPDEGFSNNHYGCLRWTATMKHTGDGLGIPATGRNLMTTGIAMARFDAAGHMVEVWQNWDMMHVMEQIQEDKLADLRMAP